MNLRFVEAFYWVATLESVTRAAEKLSLTQSAMSSRIAALEADLGVLLLDRSLRRVKLTAAGTRFLGHARSMLEFMREARVDIRAATRRRALLRVGAIESVMQAWLIPWLREIGDEYPELSIEFSVANTPSLQDQMHRGLIDIAFATLPALGEGIRVRPLPAQEMVFVVNAAQWPLPSYPLQALAGAEFMTSHRNSHSYTALLDAFRQQGVAPGIVHAISSLAAMAQLAEDGFGIAVMQRSAAIGLLRHRGARILTPTPALTPMSLFASYRADNAVQTTEAMMRSAFGFIDARRAAAPMPLPSTSIVHPAPSPGPCEPGAMAFPDARRRADDAAGPSPGRRPVHS